MYIGLLHSHTGLAYVLFLAALLNLACALVPGAKSNDGQSRPIARVMKVSHIIVLNAGRVNLLIGLGMIFMLDVLSNPLSYWWAWLSLLLWGPVEVAAKRLVKPEIQYIQDGGQPTKRLLLGTGIQLVLVATIFGIMHAK